jgi:hypothetical protein
MKKTKKELKFRFVVSEPPFNYDPRSKGAMEKLERANRTGLGDIVDNKEQQKLPASKKLRTVISRSAATTRGALK